MKSVGVFPGFNYCQFVSITKFDIHPLKIIKNTNDRTI